VTQVESLARVLHQFADNWLETFKENYRGTKQQLFWVVFLFTRTSVL